METQAAFWYSLANWLFFMLGVLTASIPFVVYLLVSSEYSRETEPDAPTEPTNKELIRTVRDAVAMELREWRA